MYDNILSQIIPGSTPYARYTGYYVEIIPKNKKRYDKPFTPSDNIGLKRQKNDRIRIIDGYSFYEIASGKKDALLSLYQVLPLVVARITDNKALLKLQTSPLFRSLFVRVFETDKSI